MSSEGLASLILILGMGFVGGVFATVAIALFREHAVTKVLPPPRNEMSEERYLRKQVQYLDALLRWVFLGAFLAWMVFALWVGRTLMIYLGV